MPWRNRSPAADLGMLDMGNWTSADVNNFAAFTEGVDLNYPPEPTHRNANTNSSADNSARDSFRAIWDEASPNLNGPSEPMDNDRPLFSPIEGEATTWYDQYGAHNQGTYSQPSTSPTYPPPSYLGSIYNFQPARNSQLELLEGVSLRDMTVEDPSEYTLMSSKPFLPQELKQEPYMSMPPNLLRYPSETTSASRSQSGHSVSPSALTKPSNKRDSEDEDGEQMMDPNYPTAKTTTTKRRRKSAILNPDTAGKSSTSHPPAVRNRHNLIEKRYRDSLQTRLLRLAQVLPSSKISASANVTDHEISSTENSKRRTTTAAGRRKSSTTTAPGGTEPQLKKAHILDEAVSYIETLEKQKETMEAQNRVLNETLKGVYDLIQQTWPETAEKILEETGLVLPEL